MYVIGAFVAHIWEAQTLKPASKGKEEVWKRDVDDILE
jgi:hypothetical protein